MSNISSASASNIQKNLMSSQSDPFDTFGMNPLRQIITKEEERKLTERKNRFIKENENPFVKYQNQVLLEKRNCKFL